LDHIWVNWITSRLIKYGSLDLHHMAEIRTGVYQFVFRRNLIIAVRIGSGGCGLPVPLHHSYFLKEPLDLF
jgi:hypothetical protein